MKTIKTNSIIEKVEKGAKLGAQLKGYKTSTREKGSFRLASDLTCRNCYEFLEKDILHWEYLNEDEAYIHIFLKEGAEVEEIQRRSFSSNSFSHFEMTPIDRNEFWFNWANSNLFRPILPPFLLPVRSPECEAKCIQEVIKGKGFTTIIPGAGPNSTQIILTEAGRNELRNCLIQNCGYWGFILTIAFNNAVAQIQGEVSVSEAPDLPEIPPFPFRR